MPGFTTRFDAYSAFRVLYRYARTLQANAAERGAPYTSAYMLVDSALRDVLDQFDADYRDFLGDRKGGRLGRYSVFDAVLWALHGRRLGVRDPKTPKWASEMWLAFSMSPNPEECRIWWDRPRLP